MVRNPVELLPNSCTAGLFAGAAESHAGTDGVVIFIPFHETFGKGLIVSQRTGWGVGRPASRSSALEAGRYRAGTIA